MTVITSMVSETIVERLFRLIEICNRRILRLPARAPDRPANATLKVRRVLADAVAEIANLKRLVRENAASAQGLRAELIDLQVENAGLRRELIDVRAQSISLRLSLFDADQRFAAVAGSQTPRSASRPSEAAAALVELKRVFAKRYHPNSVSASDGPHEAAVRAELFKEFWGDIARIEAKYSKPQLSLDASDFP
jgi:hypothetical protein